MAHQTSMFPTLAAGLGREVFLGLSERDHLLPHPPQSRALGKCPESLWCLLDELILSTLRGSGHPVLLLKGTGRHGMVSQMNLELIPKSSFHLDCSWLRGWLFLVLTLSGLLWHISELAHAQQILSTQEGGSCTRETQPPPLSQTCRPLEKSPSLSRERARSQMALAVGLA